MVKNILEDVKFIEPDTSLPPPKGMCNDCVGADKIIMCEQCKEENNVSSDMKVN
jgi:hypothetical protein